MQFLSLLYIRWYVRGLLFLGVVTFFAWIFNENLPIAGIKKIQYTFGTPNGSITQLRPMARLGEHGNEDGISYQKIIEDPVYFDMRTPVTYDTMIGEIVYKKHTLKEFRIGIKQFPTQTNFFTVPFTSVSTQGGWIKGRAEISLKEIQRLPGKYSLSLSIPGLAYRPNSDEYVLVSNAQITLQRKPLTGEKIWQYVRESFHKN